MRPTTAQHPSPPQRQPQSQPHICTTCGRSYKALETLTRHRKNHIASVQYTCAVCPASFKRKDLLDRHILTHNEPAVPSASARTPRACDRCARLKARCDNGSPCMRCLKGGHACEQSQQRRRRVTRASGSLSSGASGASGASQQSSLVSGSSPAWEALEESAATAALRDSSASPRWQYDGTKIESMRAVDRPSSNCGDQTELWLHDFEWGDAALTAQQEASPYHPYADVELEPAANDFRYGASPDYIFDGMGLSECAELQWSCHDLPVGSTINFSYCDEPQPAQGYFYNTQPWSVRL